MGRIYEAGFRGAAAAAAASYATFQMGANVRGRVREIGFFLSAATLSPLMLGHPANEATPPVASTTIAGQAIDQQDGVASVGLVGTAWSTAPTAPTVPMRRITLPAVAGAGIIWTWPADAPLIVKPSGWIVLWNFGGSAGAAPDGYVKWEE